MTPSKQQLREYGAFHLVNPDQLDGIDEWGEWLEALLHKPCSIWEEESGELILLEIRQLVDRVNGLRIEIYPNEHPPPHFHVKSPNVDASFSIDDCSKIGGTISGMDYRKIKYWHQKAKPLLIARWNSSRPTNCVVGEYVGL